MSTYEQRLAQAVAQWLADNPDYTDPTTMKAPASGRRYLENRLRETFVAARALSLEELTEYRRTDRAPLPTGPCRRCHGERDHAAGLFCARCRPLRLSEFMRSNVVLAFRRIER